MFYCYATKLSREGAHEASFITEHEICALMWTMNMAKRGWLTMHCEVDQDG